MTQNTRRFGRKYLVLIVVALLLIASVGVWVWPKFYWLIVAWTPGHGWALELRHARV